MKEGPLKGLYNNRIIRNRSVIPLALGAGLASYAGSRVIGGEAERQRREQKVLENSKREMQ